MADADSSPFAEPGILKVQTVAFYEGWRDHQGQLKTRTGTVTLARIPQWLRFEKDYSIPHTGTFIPQFRVISFPRYPQGRHKVGFTEDMYRDIETAFGLHKFTVDTFLDNNGVFLKCDDVPKIGDSALLLKVPNSKPTGLDALSMTRDATNGCIYAVYYSLLDEEGVFSALQAEPERCLHPLFFAAVMYCSHKEHVENYRRKLNDELHRIERSTGYGYPGLLDGLAIPLGQHFIDKDMQKEVDYKKVIQKLSGCQTQIAILGNTARYSESAGKWLVRVLMEMKDKEMKLVGNEVSDDGGYPLSWRETNRLLHEVEFSQNRATSLLSQLQHLKDRAQSQTTLMLGLISQKDAENSATIALSTMRDSTAMKTIAVLTTLFLPGTYVATLFSTTMFNWNPPSSGSSTTPDSPDSTPTVSPYIWVYWVISIPLTLLVMLLWLFWSRRELWKSRPELVLGKHNNSPEDSEKVEQMGKFSWGSEKV